MYTDKFYTFVEEVTGGDTVLAECIISAHKTIFESEQALEEGVASKALAGLLMWVSATFGSIAKEHLETVMTAYQEKGDYGKITKSEYPEWRDIETTYNQILASDGESEAKKFERGVEGGLKKLSIEFEDISGDNLQEIEMRDKSEVP